MKELEGKAAELLLTQQQLAALTSQRQSDLDAHAQEKDRVHADAIVAELRTQIAEGQEQNRQLAARIPPAPHTPASSASASLSLR